MKTLLIGLSLLCGVLSAGPLPVLISSNFDFDDNIMKTITKIHLYDKKTGEDKPISTELYGQMRDQVGRAGTPWADYEIRPDPMAGSFREFRSDGKTNRLLEDVKKTISGKTESEWKGNSWNAFVMLLNDERTAKDVHIITARGQSPADLHEMLSYLSSRGYFKHVPPVGNLYGVGGSDNPSKKKVEVMKTILAKIQATTIPIGAPKVLNREGTRQEAMHLWGFSDDDPKNFFAARDELKKDPNRFSHVKITLFYTGADRPEIHDRTIVLTPDGGTRPQTVSEAREIVSLLHGGSVPRTRQLEVHGQ